MGTEILDPSNLNGPAGVETAYYGRNGMTDLAWRVDTQGYSYAIDPDADLYGSYRVLELSAIPIESRTPKGGYIRSRKRANYWKLELVLWGWRNRYCAPTPEEAMADFVARRVRYIYVQARKLRSAYDDVLMAASAVPDHEWERLAGIALPKMERPAGLVMGLPL